MVLQIMKWFNFELALESGSADPRESLRDVVSSAMEENCWMQIY